MLRGALVRFGLPIVLALALVFGLNGTASAILFNFDDLVITDNDATISEYMSGLCGSPVSVENARNTNDEPLGSGGTDYSDRHLQNACNPMGPSWVTIIFETTPVDTAAFAYSGENQFRAYYATSHDDDYTLFMMGGNGWVYYDFPKPVHRLRFTDIGSGTIQVDDLDVGLNPEPGTLLLFSSGIVGLAGYGKLKFRRRKR